MTTIELQAVSHHGEDASGVTRDAEGSLRLVGRWALYGGIALAPLLVLRGPLDILASDVLLLISAGCLLPIVNREPSPTSRVLAVAGWAIALGTLLSTVRADLPIDGLFIGLRTLYVVVVLPWQVRKALRTRQHLRAAATWWIFGAVFCAAGALAQSRISPTIIPNTEALYGRSTGFAQNPNDLGGIIASSAVLVLILLSQSRRARDKILLAFALLVLTSGLLLSGAVSATLAILLALSYALIRRTISLRTSALFVLLGLALVYVAGALNPAATESPLQRLLAVSGVQDSIPGQASTLASRLQTDQFAIAGILQNPLVGRGMDAQSGLTVDGNATHNILLGVWFQGGIMALLGLVLAIGYAARLSRRRTPDFPLREALIVSLLSAFLFEMTAPEWYARYFWLQVALVITAAGICRRERTSVELTSDAGSAPPVRTPATTRRRGAQPPGSGSLVDLV